MNGPDVATILKISAIIAILANLPKAIATLRRAYRWISRLTCNTLQRLIQLIDS
ncbi:MAG: hypothetical protein NT018_00495 [Armatimonadetes bacterium]|nr:hypothetical protein [Armatimonadota bacterium]